MRALRLKQNRQKSTTKADIVTSFSSEQTEVHLYSLYSIFFCQLRLSLRHHLDHEWLVLVCSVPHAWAQPLLKAKYILTPVWNTFIQHCLCFGDRTSKEPQRRFAFFIALTHTVQVLWGWFCVTQIQYFNLPHANSAPLWPTTSDANSVAALISAVWYFSPNTRN